MDGALQTCVSHSVIIPVRRWVLANLQSEHVVIVERRKASVKKDHQGLDGNEQTNDFAGVARVAALQETPGVVDVQARNDGLLTGEDSLLNAFHDFHGMHVFRMVAGDQAEFEDHNWRVKEDTVDDDHYENESEGSRIADDKMEAGPEHDREARNVRYPADFADDGGQHFRAVVLELLEDVACGLQSDAASSDDDGPEVQATVSLEGDVDENDELDAHQVCNGTEGRDEAECYWTWGSLVDSILQSVGWGKKFDTHFHLSQPTRANVQSYWEKGWKCTQSSEFIMIRSIDWLRSLENRKHSRIPRQYLCNASLSVLLQ